MYILRLISLVTAYDLYQAIPGAYVSALVVLVFLKASLMYYFESDELELLIEILRGNTFKSTVLKFSSFGKVNI